MDEGTVFSPICSVPSLFLVRYLMILLAPHTSSASPVLLSNATATVGFTELRPVPDGRYFFDQLDPFHQMNPYLRLLSMTPSNMLFEPGWDRSIAHLEPLKLGMLAEPPTNFEPSHFCQRVPEEELCDWPQVIMASPLIPSYATPTPAL